MKLSNIWIPTAVLLSSVTPVKSKAAGANSSGGGGAIVCRDANRKIISAELLDLYEGNVRFNYKILRSDKNVNSQLEDAVQKFPDFERLRLKDLLRDVISRAEFLPIGTGLASPIDSGEAYGAVVREGCSLEGIGFYETSGKLKIAPAIYQAFSNTDKAAFFVHEALYKADRLFNYSFYPESDGVNSSHARFGTANIFASDLNQNDRTAAVEAVLSPRNQVINSRTVRAILPRAITPDTVFTLQNLEGWTIGNYGFNACYNLDAGTASSLDIMSAHSNLVLPTSGLRCIELELELTLERPRVDLVIHDQEGILYSDTPWITNPGNTSAFVHLMLAYPVDLPVVPTMP